MNAAEIEATARGCDRRRWWRWILVMGFAALLVVSIVGFLETHIKARSAAARATTLAIYNAIDQYLAEYDHLPAPLNAVEGKDWDTDSSDSEHLIHILKACDETANLKAIDFLEGNKDAKQVDWTFRNGQARREITAAIFDPWGNPYLIRLDGDGDGFVTDPVHPVKRLAKKILVWSAGKDGDPATWKDNVGSWMTTES